MNKNKKKIFIALGIIFLVVIIAVIVFLVQYQIKWRDFENFSTDRFSIKYPEGWTSENDTSDVGDMKTFKDKDEKNGVRVLILKKSDMPENQNTIEKLKNDILEQMEESDYRIYQIGEPKIESIKKYNTDAIKIDFEYETLLGTSHIIFAFFEKDEIFFNVVCQGEQIDIFNKMIESFKMK